MTPRGRTMKPQSWNVLKPQPRVVPTFNTRSVCVLVSVQGVDASATFPDRAEALSSEDTVLGLHRVSRVRVVLSVLPEYFLWASLWAAEWSESTGITHSCWLPLTVGSLTDWQHPGDLARPADWLKQRADSYRVRAGQSALILWFPL